MCTVYGLFLKNQTMFAAKHSVWPLSMLKTLNLEYCSSLGVARMLRFWFKSLQNSTVYKKKCSYKVAYSFWLCIHMKCLSVCAPSFVAAVRCDCALRVIVFGVQTTPNLYPVTLKVWLICWSLVKWSQIMTTALKLTSTGGTNMGGAATQEH